MSEQIIDLIKKPKRSISFKEYKEFKLKKQLIKSNDNNIDNVIGESESLTRKNTESIKEIISLKRNIKVSNKFKPKIRSNKNSYKYPLCNWLIITYISLFIIKFKNKFGSKIITVDVKENNKEETEDIEILPIKKERKQNKVYKRIKKGTKEFTLCKWDGKLIRNICGYNNKCLSRPSYGNKNEKAQRCTKHKHEDMSDIVHKKCNYPEGCDIRPHFGYKDNKIAERCGNHREDRIDVTSKKCNHKSGCVIRPTFGYEQDGIAQRCSDHRENMVDVKHKKCNHESGCKIRCCFGYEKDGKTQRCFNHKNEDMIDIVSKRCNHISGCTKYPNFGNEEDGILQRCGDHREDMVDVKNKRCNYLPSCNKHPSFGYEEDGKAQRCGDHREDMVDVRSKKCNHESGCKLTCRYGYEKDGIAQRCFEHKNDMINVVSKRCNYPDGCKKFPSFGYKLNKIRLRCLTHKIKDMVDVSNNSCIKCDSTIKRNKLYCNQCFQDLFPDDPNVKRMRVIELYFHNNLFNILYPNIQNNKRIIGGTSLRRPDWLIELSTHNIISECDENHHKYYDNIDEQTRTEELFKDSKKPIIIIRFNPDKYIDENGKQHPRCLKFDNMNKLIVNTDEFERRSKIIKEELIRAHKIQTKSKTIIFLFIN
jgi:hypothetical protein